MLAALLRLASGILWVPLVLSAVVLAAGDVLRGLLPVAWRRRRPAGAPARAARDADAGARPSRPAADSAACLAALARALDADPDHRGRHRYLARLEAKLASHGLRVLERAPVPGLRRALGEFEGMVRNWSDPALAELRSRLAVAVAERGSASAVWKASATVAPLARAARHAIARASAFRASRAVDLDAATR
jgi:hypothetical protein